MPFLDTKHQRAALLLLVLGAAIVIALAPYASGLIAPPVLYVIFLPLHRWVSRRVKPGRAAGLVVLFGVFIILVPGLSLAGLIVNEAQDLPPGLIRSPILDRLGELRVGQFDIGAQLATVGQKLVVFIGSILLILVGT